MSLAMGSSSLLSAHPFPLIRSGGVFLCVVGLSIMVGALVPRWLWGSFVTGVLVASIVVMITTRDLAAPLGSPTGFQVGSLLLALAIEAFAVMWLSSRLRSAHLAYRALSMLIVVGAHFFLMAPAFGPLIVLLGLSTIGSAAMGLRAGPNSWLVCWFVDGALKAGVGGAMFWSAPRITW